MRQRRAPARALAAPRAVTGLGGMPALLEGDVDWKAVMAALRATNYNGWLIPEIGSHKNEPDYIRTVSGALSKIIAL